MSDDGACLPSQSLRDSSPQGESQELGGTSADCAINRNFTMYPVIDGEGVKGGMIRRMVTNESRRQYDFLNNKTNV